MSVTFQPKKRKRRRTHGFLKRKRTAGGRAVLKRRREAGRKRIAL
ncbi:MAG: 50S ribosomal protein L34 [Patescibacteria group bacterium]|nr:50S ribosomal protein L34 [Patescibacteria group bacterium]